jgi:hypothetical protein
MEKSLTATKSSEYAPCRFDILTSNKNGRQVEARRPSKPHPCIRRSRSPRAIFYPRSPSPNNTDARLWSPASTSRTAGVRRKPATGELRSGRRGPMRVQSAQGAPCDGDDSLDSTPLVVTSARGFGGLPWETSICSMLRISQMLSLLRIFKNVSFTISSKQQPHAREGLWKVNG